MSRNWDKLRRQDKVKRPPLTPEQKRRIQKIRDQRFQLTRTGTHNQAPKFTEPVTPFHVSKSYRVVTISLPEGPAQACFRIYHGTSHADLIWTDPPLEWFTRVRHPSKIADWLSATHFQYKWGPSLSKAPPKTDSSPPGPSDASPAEAYTLKHASPSQEANTGPSLNAKATGSSIPGSSMPTYDHQVARSGMAQTCLAT